MDFNLLFVAGAGPRQVDLNGSDVELLLRLLLRFIPLPGRLPDTRGLVEFERVLHII